MVWGGCLALGGGWGVWKDMARGGGAMRARRVDIFGGITLGGRVLQDCGFMDRI